VIFRRNHPYVSALNKKKKSTAAADILSILLHVFMIPTVNFQYKGTKTETCKGLRPQNLTEHQL
jgi:hypothetical protein